MKKLLIVVLLAMALMALFASAAYAPKRWGWGAGSAVLLLWTPAWFKEIRRPGKGRAW